MVSSMVFKIRDHGTNSYVNAQLVAKAGDVIDIFSMTHKILQVKCTVQGGKFPISFPWPWMEWHWKISKTPLHGIEPNLN
jgi:hypothetical protein